MGRALAACVVACIGACGAACTHAPPAAPAATPPAGVAIAIYQDAAAGGYAVVDDRRWIAIDGPRVELDGIDPAAALPSLMIEPLGGGALRIGACERERIAIEPSARDALEAFGREQERIARERAWARTHAEPFPEPAAGSGARVITSATVRCAVTAASGRYLVRVLYVTPSTSYRVHHEVTMTAADRATEVTRFAITSAIRGERADVRLFEGRPGAAHAPREVAHAALRLDGSTAVVSAPPRAVAVRLRRIYDGALRNDVTASSDLMWGRASSEAIWVWLELALAPGERRAVGGTWHAHVELPGEPVRDVDVPAAGIEETPTQLRAPLWIDEQLRGHRVRHELAPSAEHVVDRFEIAVANTGAVAREVWIEERLRDARKREVVRGYPHPPAIAGDRVQLELRVEPAAIARTAFALAYEL